jgi:hypothetical protein
VPSGFEKPASKLRSRATTLLLSEAIQVSFAVENAAFDFVARYELEAHAAGGISHRSTEKTDR